MRTALSLAISVKKSIPMAKKNEKRGATCPDAFDADFSDQLTRKN